MLKFSSAFMVFFLLAMLPTTSLCNNVHASQELMVFAGAASKPPTEDAAKAFEAKYGTKVLLTFGGSGFVLSQMILGKKGDLFFPGSSDFMELAKRRDAVIHETEKIIVYLVPAINVQKGNPKHIKSLKDLTRPGLKVAIANPESVCVGAYAVEIVEKNLSPSEKELFRKNLVNYTESCERTATAVSLKAVDAAIGWRVFHYWDPERIETIPLPASQIVRIGYIPIAISRFTADRKAAQRFIDFLLSGEGKDIFRKYHYFMSPEEAFAWIGEQKPVGGEYKVPEEWIK
ncbi:MAG: molybdate ABC transporter substrate-binding protein, partial [Desulfomonilaceae bacterium]